MDFILQILLPHDRHDISPGASTCVPCVEYQDASFDAKTLNAESLRIFVDKKKQELVKADSTKYTECRIIVVPVNQ